MAWKDTWQDTRSDAGPISEVEEAAYEFVAREIGSKSLMPGLFAKAFSEAGGDEVKAIAIYIKYRVAQLLAQAKEEQEQEQKRKKQERVEQERTAKKEAQIEAWRQRLEEEERVQHFRATHKQDKATGVWYPIIPGQA